MSLLAAEILGTIGSGRRLVAIDGVDGSGKTSFVARLAPLILDRPVIVIHADDFLNPSQLRHAQGRSSPLGFWEDSYNYAALREQVLLPLGSTGDGWYSTSSYDHDCDASIHPTRLQSPADAVTLVEGMFLHREELADYWDASIFLDVPFTETAARMARRDGSHADPEHPSMRRYVGGQRLYFQAARPWERASFVVDNSDFTAPRLMKTAGS
ncbi:uridine kinase [Arthrobacter psychrolactophilus]|nr:uridine kinase [Arthrobacter psychrolactophilus]